MECEPSETLNEGKVVSTKGDNNDLFLQTRNPCKSALSHA